MDNLITFFICYEDQEGIVQLEEYDTVELLKIEIDKLFNIPVYNQLIDGWKVTPETDDIILKVCVDVKNVICLNVTNTQSTTLYPLNQLVPGTSSVPLETVSTLPFTSCSHYSEEQNLHIEEDMELAAAASCVTKLSTSFLNMPFNMHMCKLKDAISKSCLAPLSERRVLLLYLHNGNDEFSRIFCNAVQNSEVSQLISRSFFLLGWDVEESKFHSALINALNATSGLSNLLNMVQNKISAALCIEGVADSVMVISCLRGKVPYKNILTTLQCGENFLTQENREETELAEITDAKGNQNDMSSKNFLKLMADMLGDRDYDSFEFDEHDYLNKKIAFALRGPPQREDGRYDEKDNKIIENIHKIILVNSNQFAEFKDKVEIAFLYNCTEPLPSEKLKRAKKYSDYNPCTDINTLPIFVLRKCQGSVDPCRIFIDHTGRVYNTWQDYKERNKLPECEMILPLNGRFSVDENGEILIEKCMSPACGLDKKVLFGADIASTAGGLISGGIFVAAAIPTIAVAPVALIAGGVIGAGVGVYSIGRSAYTLYDRIRHKETLSFANSEARGAYLNIVAGSLGFVGAGANIAVSQLASRGFNIGQGARAAVNTLGVVNIGAGGASMVNSGYDVFDQWFNEQQTPSLLTIVQLGSSVLFFGHAVYNFKTASTIIEESQTRALQDYQDSLRSNRHRKSFTKLLKSTMNEHGDVITGRAEVISAIRNIPNKDEVFAVLTRSNKIMNKYGVKFTADGGQIKLNGISINMNEFISMDKKQVETFLSNLPSGVKSSQGMPSSSFQRLVVNTFSNIENTSLLDRANLITYAHQLLYFCSGDIQHKILNALTHVIMQFSQPIIKVLDEIFLCETIYLNLVRMIVGFFSKKADDLEAKYKLWKDTNNRDYYNNIFDYVDVQSANRIVKFFEACVNLCYSGGELTELAIREILTYFNTWLSLEVFEYEERREREQRRQLHSANLRTQRVPCTICGGYYFVASN